MSSRIRGVPAGLVLVAALLIGLEPVGVAAGARQAATSPAPNAPDLGRIREQVAKMNIAPLEFWNDDGQPVRSRPSTDETSRFTGRRRA